MKVLLKRFHLNGNTIGFFSKVRTTLPDSIIQARRERVLKRSLFYDVPEVSLYSSLKAEVERFDCIVAERNKKSEKSVSVLQTVIIL